MHTRRAVLPYMAASLACSVIAPVIARQTSTGQQRLLGYWSFSAEGHPTPGTLMIADDDDNSAAGPLKAMIAFTPIAAYLTQTGQGRQLAFETPWGSKYLALEQATGVFEGTVTRTNGERRGARIVPVTASSDKAARVIDLAYFGGPDCPNCRAWEAVEIPKLRAAPLFAKVRFHKVTKYLAGTIPGRFWFPGEIKDARDAIATYLPGNGSPMFALLIDGSVAYAWRHSRASAEDILAAVEVLLRQ